MTFKWKCAKLHWWHFRNFINTTAAAEIGRRMACRRRIWNQARTSLLMRAKWKMVFEKCVEVVDGVTSPSLKWNSFLNDEMKATHRSCQQEVSDSAGFSFSLSHANQWSISPIQVVARDFNSLSADGKRKSHCANIMRKRPISVVDSEKKQLTLNRP